MRRSRLLRWVMLIATGSMMLQIPSCELTLQAISTALLGGIAGGMYYLAKNV